MGNYVSENTRGDYSDNKKPLSAAHVYKRLRHSYKVVLVSQILASVVLLIVSLTFIFVLSIDSILEEKWERIVKIVLFIIPFVYLSFFLIFLKKSWNQSLGRKLTIVIDNVKKISPNDRIVKRRTGKYTRYVPEHAMYLENCGRIVITETDMNYISKDDQFYVVVDETAPDHPILWYNTKYYELQE